MRGWGGTRTKRSTLVEDMGYGGCLLHIHHHLYIYSMGYGAVSCGAGGREGAKNELTLRYGWTTVVLYSLHLHLHVCNVGQLPRLDQSMAGTITAGRSSLGQWRVPRQREVCRRRPWPMAHAHAFLWICLCLHRPTAFAISPSTAPGPVSKRNNIGMCLVAPVQLVGDPRWLDDPAGGAKTEGTSATAPTAPTAPRPSSGSGVWGFFAPRFVAGVGWVMRHGSPQLAIRRHPGQTGPFPVCRSAHSGISIQISSR